MTGALRDRLTHQVESWPLKLKVTDSVKVLKQRTRRKTFEQELEPTLKIFIPRNDQ